MTEDIFDPRARPDEVRVKATFCKKIVTKDPEKGRGVRVCCTGSNEAVTALIDLLNKAIPGDE